MTTKIINVRVSNIRPHFSNLKVWTSESSNVYIGRGGIVYIDGVRYPPKASIWANPFRIPQDGTRDEVLDKYEKYIRNKLESDSKLIENLIELKGKNLGCWCAPEPCHGDILVKLIAEYETKYN
jgi:hypothetical protein